MFAVEEGDGTTVSSREDAKEIGRQGVTTFVHNTKIRTNKNNTDRE